MYNSYPCFHPILKFFHCSFVILSTKFCLFVLTIMFLLLYLREAFSFLRYFCSIFMYRVLLQQKNYSLCALHNKKYHGKKRRIISSNFNWTVAMVSLQIFNMYSLVRIFSTFSWYPPDRIRLPRACTVDACL